MNSFLLFVSFVAFVTTIGFGAKLILSILKKDSEKKASVKKKLQVSGIVTIVAFFGFGFTLDTSNTDSTKEKEEVTEEEIEEEVLPVVSEPKEETQEEADAKKKKLEKEEAEKANKKSQEDALKSEQKEKKENAVLKEKALYVDKVHPELKSVVSEYDDIWSQIWQPTFTGLGTSIDPYTAYSNLGELVDRYAALEKRIANINSDGFSKANKGFLEAFKEYFSDATYLRKSAGQDAQKMIDSGNYSPSEMDKIMKLVDRSDASVMTAIISFVTLNQEFGID